VKPKPTPRPTSCWPNKNKERFFQQKGSNGEAGKEQNQTGKRVAGDPFSRLNPRKKDVSGRKKARQQGKVLLGFGTKSTSPIKDSSWYGKTRGKLIAFRGKVAKTVGKGGDPGLESQGGPQRKEPTGVS